jgi:hypothetical protein
VKIVESKTDALGIHNWESNDCKHCSPRGLQRINCQWFPVISYHEPVLQRKNNARAFAAAISASPTSSETVREPQESWKTVAKNRGWGVG